jgi:nucleoside-diphosphate-sugar epimerase
MSNVCVTGAAGFVGSHVALALVAAGHVVHGTVRTLDGPRAHAVLDRAGGRLKLFTADLTVPDSFDEEVAGCDVVVHTAGPVSEAVSDLEAEIVSPIVDGATHVLEACRRARVGAFVATSSVSAIGVGPRVDGASFTEADDNRICRRDYGTYAWAKLEMERVATRFCADHGIRCATLFPALVFGPSLTGELANSTQAIALMARRRMPLIPQIHSDWVDVRDVASAHLAVATDPRAAGRYIVARGQPMWLHETARVINAEFPALRVSVRRLPRWGLRVVSWFDRRVTRYYRDHQTRVGSGFDGSRLCRELGMTYQYDLRESIRDTVEALLE